MEWSHVCNGNVTDTHFIKLSTTKLSKYCLRDNNIESKQLLEQNSII